MLEETGIVLIAWDWLKWAGIVWNMLIGGWFVINRAYPPIFTDPVKPGLFYNQPRH